MPTYESVINNSINFKVALKALPQKGKLVYEYNPLRNYRVTQNMYSYKGGLYTLEELTKHFGISMSGTSSWSGVPSTESDPVLHEPGELVDFETNELEFDVEHPVDVLPQYSYDGSVNLIINDGKNIPRLINSRFSATGKNTYEIVDRKGDNDTNIYDQGSQFDIDTSLYKRVIEIPQLRLLGVYSGGDLKVGNYHFYFKYADADGNETDFVLESGLVSIFVGTTPDSVHTGFQDQNSHKLVKFYINNVDSAYQYVNVYCTRATSGYQQKSVTKAYKIDKKFLVNNSLTCDVVITGFEDFIEIPITDINVQYNIASAVDTQATSQNMLFLGNIKKPNIPYKELTDLSLRFLPYRKVQDYEITQNRDYSISSVNQGYYDPNFIYSSVGYWENEIYSLGVVYILPDNSLSEVFNIRGIDKLTETSAYTKVPLYTEINGVKTRNYITINEFTNKIVASDGENSNLQQVSNLENCKGVIQIAPSLQGNTPIYSIDIKTDKDVIEEIAKYAKGFFFVRQKRIPTTLCQALTIGVDKQSFTPVIPVKGGIINTLGKAAFDDWGIKYDSQGRYYIAERFLNNDKIISHDFLDRVFPLPEDQVKVQAAICPDYDVDYPYYNNFFTGDDFQVTLASRQPANDSFQDFQESDARHFYEKVETPPQSQAELETRADTLYKVKILGIQDGVKKGNIGKEYFSAKAGMAEEAFRFEYLGKEDKQKDATNIIRGQFGPFLGITGFNQPNKVIDIKIPGYSQANMADYFDIRYNDKASYYAISERISIKELLDGSMFRTQATQTNQTIANCFRGDCYICQFSHRLNRNFQDPSAPINHTIVDEETWKENYDPDNKESFEKINLGDVNATKLGMWITFTVRSTKNLNIRSLDESVPDEIHLNGHPRGFFPYFGMECDGSYKTPEALCYNNGFEKSTSERWNFEVPDVPYIKNNYENRIMYSDIHVNDAFKNGFRVFQLGHYKDYPKTYGSIVKLVELQGDLICVFEHGVARIPVNERAVAGEGSGGNVYINTSNVLPDNPLILSDKFGTQWEESVIKTPYYIYGIDTVAKKIWRTNGQTLECISDFSVQEFLNKNISLSERELTPIIGVRNVKSHYNAFKGDVMFTFYDNLYGFEEKVWNLCWNENLQKWITFYSWVPSFSDNIHNQYFSFDRNTSKWITKLGISKEGSDFANGVTLSNNIIKGTGLVGYLGLANRELPSGTGVLWDWEFELCRDNFRNDKLFEIRQDGTMEVNGVTVKRYGLYFTGSMKDIESEFYYRESNGTIKKDANGKRLFLPNDQWVNPQRIVSMLNIRVHLNYLNNSSDDVDIRQYITGWKQYSETNAGYYESQVAVAPQYNLQFLTTDFWKHGQAGIIDIADKIYPTYWYGKQHPFEFEFVVVDNPQFHKIFDNLQIVSNKAQPESFHYEIVGECYDFADDKINMYVRQEATKDLYQYNGADILYNRDFLELVDKVKPRIIKDENGIETGKQDKSTIFPIYYGRQDSFNEIEDYYKQLSSPNKDYNNLSGSELVRYADLNEIRIWNHTPAIDIKQHGRLRGNMTYQEDKWLIQINPIVFVQKNESWANPNIVPIIVGNSPVPGVSVIQHDIPEDLASIGYTMDAVSNDTGTFGPNHDYVIKEESWSDRKECKVKDKYVKVRVRYSGKELAIISALKTLYSISFS